MPGVTSKNNLCKQASEVLTYTMDFSNLMVTGETISTISSVTSELRGGGGSDLGLSSETIVGQTVTVIISGGTRNQTYRIEIIIISSGLSTIEGDGLLKIAN